MRDQQRVLLEQDIAGIQDYLDQFELPSNGEFRSADMNDSGEYVVVQNMPLPDGFAPDFVDLLLITEHYPALPPYGIYLLEKNNREVIAQLRRLFNVMGNMRAAPAVKGFAWVCVHYASHGWRYDSANVPAGDNLKKFLVNFYNRCCSKCDRL